MSDPVPTFAERMVNKLQAQLEAIGGIKSTGADGSSTVFADDLAKQLRYWESRVAREAGTTPGRFVPIEMYGGV